MEGFVHSIRHKWSIWHPAMLGLSLSFLFEYTAIFSELYRLKFSKLENGDALAVDFCTKLMRYTVYMIMIGFGTIPWIWSCIRSRKGNCLENLSIKVEYANRGAALYSLFMMFDGILLPALASLAASLILGEKMESKDELLSFDPHLFGIIIAYPTLLIMSLLEHRFPRGIFLIVFSIACLLSLCLPAITIFGTKSPPTDDAAIIALVQSVGFNPDHVYLAGKNQQVLLSGFGPFSRLFISPDCLGLPKSQLLALVAHELGHWYWCHPLLEFFESVWAELLFLLPFYIFRQRPWFRQFVDFPTQKPIDLPLGLSLTIFTILYHPISLIITMLRHAMNWWRIMAADNFAIKLGYRNDLIQVLNGSATSILYGLLYCAKLPINLRLPLLHT